MLSDRDRLIKSLDGADLFLRNRANSKPEPLNEYDIENMLDIAKLCDEAARTLEKAIIPPCNVGDMVYAIGTITGQIIESVVITIIHSENNIFLHLENETVVDVFQQLGKTVFLTKEEAEAKLREFG